MFAAHLESPNKIIGLLLEAGADPLALNKAGDSALTLAREENNTRAYDLLMAATATRVEEDEVL
jgi:ankyrin repeat protein